MTDYQRLDALLDSIGYSQSPVKKAVLEVFQTLDAQDLGVDQRRAVGHLFDNFLNDAIGHPGDGSWEDFKLGETRVGAVVRVKKDAYEAPGGDNHNGLVGHLVAIRSGRCIVQYLGRNDGVGHYHPPHMIEVLKQ